MTKLLIRRALHDFNQGDAFFNHLTDDIILEFPYGPTLGLPGMVIGKDAVRIRLGAAQDSGLRISDPRIVQAGERGFLAEYTGTYRGVDGSTAEVPLVAFIEHDGTAITRIREYWDTLRIATLMRA